MSLMEFMGDKAEMLEALRKELKECSLCPKMVESRKQVMGEDHYPCTCVGDENAKYMFVGIAPGRVKKEKKDEGEDTAFKYGSGKILKKAFDELGIHERDVFITNIVKCNTPEDGHFIDDDIWRCYKHFLSKEIAIINPRIIFALGRDSQRHLETLVPNGVKITYLFHPAAVMRGYVDYERFKEALKEKIHNGK